MLLFVFKTYFNYHVYLFEIQLVIRTDIANLLLIFKKLPLWSSVQTHISHSFVSMTLNQSIKDNIIGNLLASFKPGLYFIAVAE